jgi:hypothetical protein
LALSTIQKQDGVIIDISTLAVIEANAVVETTEMMRADLVALFDNLLTKEEVRSLTKTLSVMVFHASPCGA